MAARGPSVTVAVRQVAVPVPLSCWDRHHQLGGNVRRATEVAFEMSTGGMQPLGSWLTKRHMSGVSLRQISRELFEMTGVQVSHETIRAWIREG
jgi:hypothetical protein